MGLYAGTIHDHATSLIAEHGAGEWRVDCDTWVGMLQEMYRSQPILEREPTLPALATFYGMTIRMDDTLPAGTIELRNAQNEILGRIENVGSRPSTIPPMAQQEPRRVVEYDEFVYEGEAQRIIVRKPRPATGPTTRLPIKCRRCHDTLPMGATYCIECGEKV